MAYIIAGLGNPGEEYENTRHNTGRMVLDSIRKEFEGEDFSFNKKLNAQTAGIEVGSNPPSPKATARQGKKQQGKLIAPDTFMNRSGSAIAPLVKSVKAAEKLIVIYDDFNLPLGRIRVSFNRSSGGHNGVESIIKAVKTEAFLRIRVGTAPATAKGLAKTPHGDDKIEKFILGKFKDDELKEIKKAAKKAAEAIRLIMTESKEKAMSVANGL